MSIITPSDTALAYLQQFTPGQQRFDLSEQSDTTGHTATRLGGPPRWTVALRTLDALEPAVSALWKAIAVQLRGRVNHLALHDITQPQPRGSLRGAVTLSSTAAAGAGSVAMQGAISKNVLFGSGFEIHTSGPATPWSSYTTGTTGTVAYGSSGGITGAGGLCQRITALGLGTTSADVAGVFQAVNATALAGQSVAFSATIAAYDGAPKAMLYLTWRNGGTVLGSSSASVSPTASPARFQLVATAPPTANAVDVFIWMHSRTGSTGLAVIDVDDAQLEIASAATSYSGPATLSAGDWLQIGAGVGSHYCMVAADATANDAGAITATFEPPLRKAFTSGTAVTWDKPKGHYKQRPDSLSWSGAAGSNMVGGFAFDLMEDWSA